VERPEAPLLAHLAKADKPEALVSMQAAAAAAGLVILGPVLAAMVAMADSPAAVVAVAGQPRPARAAKVAAVGPGKSP
jgi:hypothetical protein